MFRIGSVETFLPLTTRSRLIARRRAFFKPTTPRTGNVPPHSAPGKENFFVVTDKTTAAECDAKFRQFAHREDVVSLSSLLSAEPKALAVSSYLELPISPEALLGETKLFLL